MDRANTFISAAQLTSVDAVAQGLEFQVFKANSPKYGRVVLRVPKHKVFQNVNDPNNDAKELISQELKIYKLLHGGPVPVPKPFELLDIQDYPAMLSQYVDDDGSEASASELGRMAALIHSTKLPDDWDIRLVAMEGRNVFDTLVNRIERRFEQFCKAEPNARSWMPNRDVLQRITERMRSLPTCLLHMDLRDVNLRVQHGKVAAVIDWTNTMIGPAAVDFYRIVELVRPGPGFIDAYAALAPLPQVTAEEETFLRLDAALMLSLVFISEAPDPVLRISSVKRVEELVKSLPVSN